MQSNQYRAAAIQMTLQPTSSVQQLGTQIVGPTPILNPYRPGFLQMTPQSTGSLQQVTPQMVAPTGMATDSILNQFRPPTIPVTPQSTVSVHQLVPQFVAPAAVASTDSMWNQYTPPQIVPPTSVASTDSNQYRPGYLQVTPQSMASLQNVTPQIVAQTAMSTNSISNQERTAKIQITLDLTVSMQQLAPEFVAPAPYSISNQFRPPGLQVAPQSTAPVNTLQQVSQGSLGRPNSEHDLETLLQPTQHGTKLPELTGQSTEEVENKVGTVTNAEIHSVTAVVKSDDNIPKSVAISSLSAFGKVNTPVKNSSNVNILSNPITMQTPSHRSGGPHLKDRLYLLEKNMNQLFIFLTSGLNKSENTKTAETAETKMAEEKKEEPLKMFDDDDDSVINVSPGRESLNQEIGTIISSHALFEPNNVETYQEFKDEVIFKFNSSSKN